MKDPEARNSSHSRRLSTLPLSQKDAGAPGGFEETDPVLAADRHTQACDAGRRRRAHIGVAVPDKHSVIRSEAQIPHRHLHHSWGRLAAIAAIVGAVRTKVDRLKPQPFRRQHGTKASMNLLKPRDVEVPARDPRLICDQDKLKSGVPQQLQPFNCARRKLDSLRIGQVDPVDDDCSVAIDKRDPPRRRLVHWPIPGWRLVHPTASKEQAAKAHGARRRDSHIRIAKQDRLPFLAFPPRRAFCGREGE
jgi:hypothetical protein